MKPIALIIEAEYYPQELLRQLEEKVSIIKSSAVTQEQLRSDLQSHACCTPTGRNAADRTVAYSPLPTASHAQRHDTPRIGQC